MSVPSMNRREALAGLCGLPLPLLRIGPPVYDPKLLAHTHIWVLEARRRKAPLADLAEEAFSSTHRAGYRRIELVSDFLEMPMRDHTLRLLKKHRLEPTVVAFERPFAIGGAVENTRQELLASARVMGDAGASAIAFTPSGAGNADEQIRYEAFQLTSLGQDLRRAGMELLLHHSVADLQDRAWRWKRLIAATEPTLVGICLDLDMARRAGHDPIALLNETSNRLGGVHLCSTRNGIPLQELDEGDIDLERVAGVLRRCFFQGYLTVDLRPDITGEHTQTAGMSLYKSRGYMQRVFGPRPGYLPVDMGPHVRIKGF
jgi:sugar phosphate isomerase/epimerase